MCLYIKSGPHVAEKDFVVWKSLRPDNTPPYFNGFKYHCNVDLPVVTLRPVLGHETGAFVGRGYHALVEPRPLWDGVQLYLKVCAMVVRKGTTYYLGDNGDIVAESLFTGSLRDFRTYT